jgi:hypothetical protein
MGVGDCLVPRGASGPRVRYDDPGWRPHALLGLTAAEETVFFSSSPVGQQAKGPINVKRVRITQ